MSKPNSRSYHGQKKRKSIGSLTLAADPGVQVIRIDASKGDLFSLITASGGSGATNITLNVVNAHDGQTLWVRYDANNASDDATFVVQLEGTNISFTEPTVTTAGDHLYEIKIIDASDAATVLIATDEIT